MPIDFTKSMQTRDGRPVRILCTDAKGRSPIIGLIVQPNAQTDAICTWCADGHRFDFGTDNPLDLQNISVKHTGWINIRKIPARDKTFSHFCSHIFPSREDALKEYSNTDEDEFITVQIEWEV